MRFIVGLVVIAACGRADFDPIVDGTQPVADVATSFATPSLVQTQADGSSGTTIDVPINTTRIGDLLVVVTGGWGPPANATAMTDDAGNVYTSADALAVSSSGNSNVWYANRSRPGATTITVSFGAATNIEIWMFELSGMDMASPLDAVGVIQNGTVSDPLAAPLVTTTIARSFIVSVEQAPNSITGIHDAPPLFSALQILSGDNTAYFIAADAGPYGAVWDDTNNGAFNATTAAFKAAAL